MSHRVFARRGAAPPLRQSPGASLLLDRRALLQTTFTAIGAYAVAASGITWLVGPGRAWALSYDSFDPELAQSLLHMTRALYPHDFLGDVHYAQVVKDLDAEAAGFDDKSRLEMLRDGIARLDAAKDQRFVDLSAEDKEAALEGEAGSEFFEAVRGKTVVSLYNQPAVWEEFGYEGPSYEEGGYLYRGFDDLSWLPDPPAEASPPVDNA